MQLPVGCGLNHAHQRRQFVSQSVVTERAFVASTIRQTDCVIGLLRCGQTLMGCLPGHLSVSYTACHMHVILESGLFLRYTWVHFGFLEYCPPRLRLCIVWQCQFTDRAALWPISNVLIDFYLTSNDLLTLKNKLNSLPAALPRKSTV